jgi:hypothetical protein
MEIDAPTRDLLTWIANSPRTYTETLEVWRTNCPRLSVWEDALDAGLVRVKASKVELTERGESVVRL